MGELLRIEDLRVSFPVSGPGGMHEVLAGVNLSLDRGQATALVGPSGCGKTLLTRALLGLLPPGATWQGKIKWQGQWLNDPQGRLRDLYDKCVLRA